MQRVRVNQFPGAYRVGRTDSGTIPRDSSHSWMWREPSFAFHISRHGVRGVWVYG